MKYIVYPAVLETDESDNTYCFNFQDLNVVSPGVSVEHAFLKACSDFQTYIEFIEKFEFNLPEPTEFLDCVKLNPKRRIMLFRAKVQGEKVVLMDTEKAYKRMIQEMIE